MGYQTNDLIRLGQTVSKYCVGIEGNVSKKIDNGLIIKASGRELKTLSDNDLVSFDIDGKQLDNFQSKGSMELGFHQALLKYYDYNYIAHTHPVNTLKILCTPSYSSILSDFRTKRLFPDQVIFNGATSCFIPYTTPGDSLVHPILAKVDMYRNNYGTLPKLILLQNHGIIALGKSVDECITITEICEKAAEILIGCYQINSEISFLPKEEINILLNDKNEIYRQSLI